MSGKRVNLDLGLVSLPLGEGRGRHDDGFRPPEEADRDDVSRLEALLGRGGRGDGRPGEDAPPQEAAALSGPSTAARTAATLAQAGAEIERLWIAHGAQGAERKGETADAQPAQGPREARLRMRPGILADTTVCIHVDGGRLGVGTHVGCEATRRWLEAELPALARTLEQRLRGPLHLLVRGVGAAQPIHACLDWPGRGRR